jgi:hypothetical protein
MNCSFASCGDARFCFIAQAQTIANVPGGAGFARSLATMDLE